MTVADLYQRPNRDRIAEKYAAEAAAGAPSPAPAPPEAATAAVPLTRQPQPPEPDPHKQDAGADVLAWFGAHVRVALRIHCWSKLDLSRAVGCNPPDVVKAASGTGCSLGLAGRIAVALGSDLAHMVQPLACPTCAGAPPAGFGCLECGTQTPMAPGCDEP